MKIRFFKTAHEKELVSVENLLEIQNFEIEKTKGGSFWNTEELSSELKSPQSELCLFQDELSQNFEGFIFYQILPMARDFEKECWILHWAIKPKATKQKIAQNLFLSFLNELLKKPEIKQCGLEVSEKNKAAISIYEKANFKKISTRQNYYKDQSAAWIMIRS